MRPSPPPPVCLRALRLLGGAGADGRRVEPPLLWSARGSLAGLVRGRVAHIGRTLAPVGAALDGVARGLLAIPVRALLLFPACAAVLRLLSDSRATTWIVTLLFAVAVLSVLLRVVRVLYPGDSGRTAARLLLLGAVLRLVLGTAIATTGGLPDEHGYYHPLAADTAACWAHGAPSLLADHAVVQRRGAYYLLLSGAYFAVGSEMVVGRVMGALLGLMVALLCGELARCVAGPRAAMFALGLLALHPEHAFWSTTLSRDTLTSVLVLAGLLALARRPGRILPLGLLLAAVSVLLLFQCSFLAAAALGGAVVVAVAAEAVTRSGHGLRLVGGCVLAGGLLLGSTWFLLDRYGMWLRPDVLTAIRQGADVSPLAEGNPGPNDFPSGLAFEGPLDLLVCLPVGLVFVLLAPFPWHAVHATRFLYSLLQVPGMAITVLGIVGTGLLLRRGSRAVVAPVLFLIFCLGILALVEGSSGIVARHRLPLTAVLTAGAGALLAGLRREERA